jgi:hypothetical protein
VNKRFEERDRLIFGEPVDWERESGGMKSFVAMDADTLQELVEGGFAQRGDRQNAAPPLSAFLGFMRACPGKFLAHGYAISPARPDCRVTVEGLRSVHQACFELAVPFVRFCQGADHLELWPQLYAWWD